MAATTLHHPKRIAIGLSRPAHTVTHALYPVPQHLKTALLLDLLKQTDTESVLIFTRTKHRAHRLSQQIERSGFKVTSLHSDRTQGQRQSALSGFKSGQYHIMVATDIAARGLDIDALSHVINYDLPGSPDDYIHRVGRTARMDATGDAFTFVTPEDERDLRTIEQALTCRIPRITLPGFDYTIVESSSGSARSERGGRRFSGGGGRSGNWRRESRGSRGASQALANDHPVG